jgi:hypothetical protein
VGGATGGAVERLANRAAATAALVAAVRLGSLGSPGAMATFISKPFAVMSARIAASTTRTLPEVAPRAVRLTASSAKRCRRSTPLTAHTRRRIDHSIGICKAVNAGANRRPSPGNLASIHSAVETLKGPTPAPAAPTHVGSFNHPAKGLMSGGDGDGTIGPTHARNASASSTSTT